MNAMLDFDSLYQEVLLPHLDKYELKRKKYVRKFKRNAIISLPFLILIILTVIAEPIAFVIFVLSIPFMIILGFGLGKIQSLRKDLRPKFKKNILFPILQNLYEDIEYLPRQRMSKQVLNNSLLLKKYAQRTGGDDFVRCKIGQTNIQFCEAEAYSRKTDNMFYAGIFISVSFNKTFKSKTVVFPESFSNRAQRLSFKFRRQMEDPKVVKLEDPEFEKKFVVIGEDQVESRYILSTSLMQRLYEYEERFKKKVSFSFINNRLYISIPIKYNMFEPRLFDPLNDKEYIKYNYDYFKLLTDVVNDLDLNTRIWQ